MDRNDHSDAEPAKVRRAVELLQALGGEVVEHCPVPTCPGCPSARLGLAA